MAMSKENNNSSAIKICTINICGLSSRSRFVLDKYVYDSDFDVVAVQETGSDDIESILLSNMTTVTDSNHATNRGAALYVKDQHSITKLEEISQNFNSLDSCWGLTVINGTRYILGNVYVNLEAISGVSHILSMLDRAQRLSSKLKAKGVILIGDMNARHQSWGDSTSNEYGKKLFEDLDNSQFTIMTANTPSFLCVNGSSFIDLVIISNSIASLVDKIETDTNIELFSGAPLRGHVPVIVHLESNSNETSPNIKKLSIKDVNWNDWSHDIEHAIENSNNVRSVNEDPKMLLQFIENILNESTGRHGKIITSSFHSKPYWNAKLSELSKQLRIDRKNFSYRNTDSNKVKFLQSKDAFDQERKTACQEFIMEKTRNLNAVEAHKFWKEFKKITLRKTNQNINPLENEKGDILTENEEIEQLLFSTFFECKHMESVDFNEEFYQETNDTYKNIITQDDPPSEEAIELNSPITAAEISKTIKEIKSSGKSFDNHSCRDKNPEPSMPHALISNKPLAPTEQVGHHAFDSAPLSTPNGSINGDGSDITQDNYVVFANFPPYTSEEDIMHHFSEFHPIQCIMMLNIPMIEYKDVTYAIIVFQNLRIANEAVGIMDGRKFNNEYETRVFRCRSANLFPSPQEVINSEFSQITSPGRQHHQPSKSRNHQPRKY